MNLWPRDARKSWRPDVTACAAFPGITGAGSVGQEHRLSTLGVLGTRFMAGDHPGLTSSSDGGHDRDLTR